MTCCDICLKAADTCVNCSYCGYFYCLECHGALHPYDILNWVEHPRRFCKRCKIEAEQYIEFGKLKQVGFKVERE